MTAECWPGRKLSEKIGRPSAGPVGDLPADQGVGLDPRESHPGPTSVVFTAATSHDGPTRCPGRCLRTSTKHRGDHVLHHVLGVVSCSPTRRLPVLVPGVTSFSPQTDTPGQVPPSRPASLIAKSLIETIKVTSHERTLRAGQPPSGDGAVPARQQGRSNGQQTEHGHHPPARFRRYHRRGTLRKSIRSTMAR